VEGGGHRKYIKWRVCGEGHGELVCVLWCLVEVSRYMVRVTKS